MDPNSARPFHKDLGAATRRETLKQFEKGEVRILVVTPALSARFDTADVYTQGGRGVPGEVGTEGAGYLGR